MERGAEPGMVLEIEDLCVELSIEGRWVRAVDHVSLYIRRGEVLGLVGESGSGKSLTALSIPRLLPDNGRIVSGAVRLLGEDVRSQSEQAMNRLRARSVAVIFQNPTTYLNPVLRVGAQIAEAFEVNPDLLDGPASPRVISAREARRRAWWKSIEYLRLVKIPDAERVARQYPFELSGGMQQRVVIAMALARQPDLVIADEITTALDVTVQAQILGLLSELRRATGMTLLLITHDMGIVAQLADRVAVMYSGSIVECADVRSLFRQPRHPYAKALLEAVPVIRGNRTVFRPIPGTMPPLTDPPGGCRFHPRCPDVLARCAGVKPDSVHLEPGHMVACHLYGAR